MKIFKKLGIAAMASMMAMAMAGTSTASASSTALCNVHELSCAAGNMPNSIHMVNTTGTTVNFLFGMTTVKCLSALLQAAVGVLSAPQAITATGLVINSCGTAVPHNNCTVTVLELPEFNLLKTALNLGTLTPIGSAVMYVAGDSGGILNLKCVVGGFSTVDCDYDLSGVVLNMEGAEHQGPTTGFGMVTASAKNLPLSSGLHSIACPMATSFDALLEPLKKTYIVA